MSDEKIDYAAVLADLVAKRDQLNAAIEAIEVMTGQTVTPSGSRVKDEPTEVRSDSFFGLTFPQAAKKYLAIAKRPQSAKEIAEALNRGGITHQSTNFTNTIYTTLKREDDRGGDIIKVGKHWGLASWYPGRVRKKKEIAVEDAGEGTEVAENSKKAAS
jgi:hypothetical protein